MNASLNMLVTGGAGFIGSNSALAFVRRGWNVVVLDNLSRKGAELNLDWLRQSWQRGKDGTLSFVKCDVRDREGLEDLFRQHAFDAVLHLAGQVAVTTSVAEPRDDFDVNAGGTFNVLDATRRHRPEAAFVYASTNKVYGNMEKIGIVERNGRHEYAGGISGIDETAQLDFHSPYGCSKGAGDQYVIDFARIYGLRATSFRQSCIYGPRQFGVEDQGWVAWFTIAAILQRPITIFGDGRQIRDVLHVDDLIDAYVTAFEQPEKIAGQAFNIGGGPKNTLSLLELIALLEEALGTSIPLRFAEWRPGDQKVFVCNLDKASGRLSWRPRIGGQQGVRSLVSWVTENADMLRRML